MAQHNQDMKLHEARDARTEQVFATHEQHNKAHERQIGEWDSKVQHVVSKDWTGEKGEKGDPGQDAEEVNIEALIGKIMSLIPEPKNGENGKDAIVDEDKIITKLVKKIQKEKSLDLTHIRNASSFLKDGVKYKFEELMHGGGSKAGNGLVYLPLVSGSIDNSNTIFTFASTPTIVVVNGNSYINGAGVTISGTTVTLASPAGVGGSVYALG